LPTPLKHVDGQIIGSIGVSGGQIAQDYAIAQSKFEFYETG
jgi:uncharacterized protein GlcG (DUF336 family)